MTWARLVDVPIAHRPGIALVSAGAEVLAIGGYTPGVRHVDTLATADGSAWDRRPDAPFPVMRWTAVSIQGRAYSWGFHRAINRDGAGECPGAVYDPALGRWAGVAPIPMSPRDGCRLAASSDRVLVWGGSDKGSRHQDGFVYDVAQDRWQAIGSPFPVPLDDYAAVWTDRECVIWGAGRGQGFAAAFDPVSKSWRTLPPAPVRHAKEVAAVWTGRQCIFAGGRGSPRAPGSDLVLAYDPRAEEWTPWRSLPQRVSRPAMVEMDGVPFVVGLGALHRWDGRTGAWIMSESPLPIGGGTATVAGNQVWVAAARSDTGYLPIVAYRLPAAGAA